MNCLQYYYNITLTTSFTCLDAGKGQMVCGSCRQLLSYPRGVKYVQCSCCQTVNLVLEGNNSFFFTREIYHSITILIFSSDVYHLVFLLQLIKLDKLNVGVVQCYSCTLLEHHLLNAPLAAS